jgi:hypothetical protein
VLEGQLRAAQTSLLGIFYDMHSLAIVTLIEILENHTVLFQSNKENFRTQRFCFDKLGSE